MKICCTKCGKRFKVPAAYAGRRVRCFHCKTAFHAVEAGSAAASEEGGVSLWRVAIIQAAQRYGGYQEAPTPPPSAEADNPAPEVALPRGA